MTATQNAARQIADTFYQLSADERDDLLCDAGLTVDIDGTNVAVWHRTDDNKIVAFTNPNHPDDGEEWAEIDAPEPRYHVFTTDAVAMHRTSANVSPWSVDPMTRDEVVSDIVDELDGVDLDWNGNEVTATITNPITGDRERTIFVLDQA